jgi:N-acetyl-anhydromuramyl-L-alanine amidase AmpD
MIGLMLLLQLIATQPKMVQQLLPQRRVEFRDTTRNYIIIHNDGGSGGYSSARATLIKRRLSYHYYVKRDGTIIKLLDPKYQASHVGYSMWKGLVRINRYSIGICLENGITKPYTTSQYQSTGWLIKQLRKRYKDTTTYTVVGHSDVALPLGRKDDPGPNFDWKKLSMLLNVQEI